MTSPLPSPRGTLSKSLVTVLAAGVDEDLPAIPDPDGHEDEALTLWVLHELHYRGFAGVDDRWEWHPGLLAVRRRLEQRLEQRLRDRLPRLHRTDDVVADLEALVASCDAPSLARHLRHEGTREQALDLLRQRSLYHLKEADPTTWVLPRLGGGRVKASLVEIQLDEYGGGHPERIHHTLYARAMAACGLSDVPGAYVDDVVPEVLEQSNAVSMFGLQRRLRGAALGHFAAFESTSSLPSRQLVQAYERLGLPAEAIAYYDEHVEADAVHEQLALRDVVGGLVAEEPGLAEDVLLGAWTCADLEGRTARAMLERWGAA